MFNIFDIKFGLRGRNRTYVHWFRASKPSTDRLLDMVGSREFESLSSCLQCRRVTKLHQLPMIGTPGGIRIHTVQILSLLPLPVGLREHVWYSLPDSDRDCIVFETIASTCWAKGAYVWYLGWDSNPQNSESKSDTYTISVTGASGTPDRTCTCTTFPPTVSQTVMSTKFQHESI